MSSIVSIDRCMYLDIDTGFLSTRVLDTIAILPLLRKTPVTCAMGHALSTNPSIVSEES